MMMVKITDLLNRWRENVFFFSLILLAGVFPFSEALVSIFSGILFFQALVLRSWFHPTVRERSWRIVLMPVSVYVIYLIGTLFTQDITFALYELKKTVFWVAIPLAVFLSPKLPEKRLYFVFLVFIGSVTVASLIITGRLLLHDYFQFEGFRAFSIVSHIRFSLQVVLALILLLWFIIRGKYREYGISPMVVYSLLLWLALFLFLLKSLSGIFAFIGTAGISLLYFAVKTKSKRVKIFLLIFLVVFTAIPGVFVGRVFYDYYDFKEVDPDKVEKYTASGNPYSHDFKRSMRENGHLVDIYICEDELRQEWNKRSEIKYDDIVNGYPLGSTLMRYLTSLGYKKDSTGVSKLIADDIRLIEEGVTNFKFKNRYFSIYPRIYESIWEMDQYFRSGNPNDKSLAQRIEFIKASLLIIKEKPLFGIGTGNWKMKYDEVYNEMDTKLAPEKRGPSHNQYLNYMVKFGLAGFVWIMLVVLIPVFSLGNKRNFMFMLFLVAYAFASLGDANLETHMGLSFFIFFYSLFLWNSTSEMKQSVLKS
jgi:hypothetical protein